MADFQTHDANRAEDDDREIEIEITDPDWIARFDAARERHARETRSANRRRHA